MTAIAFDSRSYSGSNRQSSGVSDVAAAIAAATLGRLSEYRRTARGQSLFVNPAGELSVSLAEANELALVDEATRPSAATLKEAHELLDSLPEAFRRPLPVIEPSGAIGFEWDLGSERFAILALKGIGVLEFSVATGPGEREWGVRSFAGRLDARTLRTLAELGARA